MEPEIRAARQCGEHRLRRAVALVAVVAALLGSGLVAPSPAQASPASDEVRMLNLTNQLRSSVGVGPLTLDPTVSAVSRIWAAAMAAIGGISHNPDRTVQISDWVKLGENVGMGGNVDAIHEALVASPGHYRNLVDPDFSVVGIGVVYSGSTVFIAQNFVKPLGGGDGEIARAAPEPDPEPASPAAESSRQAEQGAETAAPLPAATPAPVPAPPPAESVAELDPLRSVQSMQINFVLEQLRAPAQPR